MSTNIHIIATREILVVKTGEKDTQTEYGQVWQTPTATTRKIVAAEDKLQAYKEWVLAVSEPYEVDIYAPGDIFCEGEPIGQETHNDGEAHIAELEEWIAFMTSKGFEITWEGW